MTERERVLLERGFVLHHRPYRNSSQIVECLTADHGRVGLVAQGSRRAANCRRAHLQPFVPLRLSWTRRGELGRLTDVEPEAADLALRGQALLAGYYVNELVLHLSVRDDPNGEVFDSYDDCLAALAEGSPLARTVRLFELALLRGLGYGLELDRDASTGEPLQPECRYVFELEHGPRRADAASDGTAFWGRELISLHRRSLDDRASLRAAKRLLGRVLNSYLGQRRLKTRAVLEDIVELGIDH